MARKTRKHHFGGPAVFAAMSKLPMKSSGRNLVKNSFGLWWNGIWLSLLIALFMDLRALYREMLIRMPEGIRAEDDIIPGGDIRLRGNVWLRSAFKASGLKQVPRESQCRLAVAKVFTKKRLVFRSNLISLVRFVVFLNHSPKTLFWVNIDGF